MRKLLAVCCLIGGSVSICHADDKRIVEEVYDKSRVYNVYTQVGRATLIQFEDDESLVISDSSVLGIGDADEWDLGVRGSSLVLKPWKDTPNTNMVVVTNKRAYSFELMPTPIGKAPTYILRYRYPDTEQAKANAEALAEAKRIEATAAAKAEKIEVNTNYVWRGDNELLKPTAAFDDGRFTRLIYDNAAELPVFYKLMPDGSEALLNSNVDPENRRIVVLHEVIRTVRARMGDEVIEIINRSYKLPKFNNTGSGVHGVVRVEKAVPNE